jgi:membrane-associated phospholipid phosphatase
VLATALIVGCVGLLSGAGWLLPAPRAWDAALMLRLNAAGAPVFADRLLAGVRLLGTTPFFIAALGALGVFRPQHALALGLAALAAEGVTKGIKILLRRARPFESNPQVILRLARRPIDASFPSGDAMRAAFLAGAAWAAAPAAGGLAAALSVVVGLGRVRAGVHYPLDVWAGWCLGLSASLTWLAWTAG